MPYPFDGAAGTSSPRQLVSVLQPTFCDFIRIDPLCPFINVVGIWRCFAPVIHALLLLPAPHGGKISRRHQ